MTAIGRGERRPLKVLHIDPERKWGGGEVQVYGLLSYLAEMGHRNDLLTHPQGRLFSACAKLKVERLGLTVRNDLDLRAVPELRRRIAKEDYDIVHLHTKRAHSLALWLRRKGARPRYVVTRRMDYPEKRNWYTRQLYNRRVDGVVAISATIKNLLIAAGVEAGRIRLIHSGIDAKRFSGLEAIARSGPPTLGCLAVLEERKGIQYLLEAVARLRGKGHEIKCLIGGSGSLRAGLEQQARDLDLSDSVGFLGFVADGPGFLDGIDIFVMPSLHEGLGVAVLEAMAAGKAVVASGVGGLAESVVNGETGFLVAPRDAEALADAIAKLLARPELARQMGRAGRARALGNFTLAQMAAQNESYYYELLGEARQ